MSKFAALLMLSAGLGAGAETEQKDDTLFVATAFKDTPAIASLTWDGAKSKIGLYFMNFVTDNTAWTVHIVDKTTCETEASKVTTELGESVANLEYEQCGTKDAKWFECQAKATQGSDFGKSIDSLAKFQSMTGKVVYITQTTKTTSGTETKATVCAKLQGSKRDKKNDLIADSFTKMGEWEKNVTGSVRLGEFVGDSDKSAFVPYLNLAGVDYKCGVTSEGDKCLMKVHKGTSCDDVSDVDPDTKFEDAWSKVMYEATSDGNTTELDDDTFKFPVVMIKGGKAKLLGKTLVVYDSEGKKIACSVIKDKPTGNTGKSAIVSMAPPGVRPCLGALILAVFGLSTMFLV